MSNDELKGRALKPALSASGITGSPFLSRYDAFKHHQFSTKMKNKQDTTEFQSDDYDQRQVKKS
ncbi:MAG TPA: hypothetical protein DEB17_08375 [Chlorobaculum sp.]|jgi:hypothetical protein|uniref:Uncharacterized protein n=1 Tax=Chlorobaculum tepidum (strain ATCC 49652 / DSM 12025 / NBRC 103806 / TLS) TaxID=194439 RepID=Q8KDB4_CHLTE|nr:hypothetical protein CT1140 [Chlorobaculum tepidum TLS]HBU23987.1 hypothetical protein [Chlorobaculum sp.]